MSGYEIRPRSAMRAFSAAGRQLAKHGASMQLLLLWLRGGIRTHDLTAYEAGGDGLSPTPHLTGWCPWHGSNARPESYKDPALPTELHGHDPSRLCPHAMTRQAETPLHVGAAAPTHMPTRSTQCLCAGTPEMVMERMMGFEPMASTVAWSRATSLSLIHI